LFLFLFVKGLKNSFHEFTKIKLLYLLNYM
jgi:hypothetical protein